MPIGVSYNSDLHLAIKLCIEAASECDRIKNHPAPKCQLIGFGDNSVDLEIRAWIDDPQNGRGGVINECLLKVWDKFHENDIEFPYPQRDIHIKTVEGQLSSVLGGKT
jgi:small-conductance mechanosensitive channel